MKQTQNQYLYEHKCRHIAPILIRCQYIRCFYPLLRCQRKSIVLRLSFKPIEFDRFKIRIVNLFPQAQKRNRRIITHPVCYHNKCIIWIFIFDNISERNVSISHINYLPFLKYTLILIFKVYHIPAYK